MDQRIESSSLKMVSNATRKKKPVTQRNNKGSSGIEISVTNENREQLPVFETEQKQNNGKGRQLRNKSEGSGHKYHSRSHEIHNQRQLQQQQNQQRQRRQNGRKGWNEGNTSTQNSPETDSDRNKSEHSEPLKETDISLLIKQQYQGPVFSSHLRNVDKILFGDAYYEDGLDWDHSVLNELQEDRAAFTELSDAAEGKGKKITQSPRRSGLNPVGNKVKSEVQNNPAVTRSKRSNGQNIFPQSSALPEIRKTAPEKGPDSHERTPNTGSFPKDSSKPKVVVDEYFSDNIHVTDDAIAFLKVDVDLLSIDGNRSLVVSGSGSDDESYRGVSRNSTRLSVQSWSSSQPVVANDPSGTPPVGLTRSLSEQTLRQDIETIQYLYERIKRQGHLQRKHGNTSPRRSPTATSGIDSGRSLTDRTKTSSKSGTSKALPEQFGDKIFTAIENSDFKDSGISRKFSAETIYSDLEQISQIYSHLIVQGLLLRQQDSVVSGTNEASSKAEDGNNGTERSKGVSYVDTGNNKVTSPRARDTSSTNRTHSKEKGSATFIGTISGTSANSRSENNLDNMTDTRARKTIQEQVVETKRKNESLKTSPQLMSASAEQSNKLIKTLPVSLNTSGANTEPVTHNNRYDPAFIDPGRSISSINAPIDRLKEGKTQITPNSALGSQNNEVSSKGLNSREGLISVNNDSLSVGSHENRALSKQQQRRTLVASGPVQLPGDYLPHPQSSKVSDQPPVHLAENTTIIRAIGNPNKDVFSPTSFDTGDLNQYERKNNYDLDPKGNHGALGSIDRGSAAQIVVSRPHHSPAAQANQSSEKKGAETHGPYGPSSARNDAVGSVADKQGGETYVRNAEVYPDVVKRKGSPVHRSSGKEDGLNLNEGNRDKKQSQRSEKEDKGSTDNLGISECSAQGDEKSCPIQVKITENLRSPNKNAGTQKGGKLTFDPGSEQQRDYQKRKEQQEDAGKPSGMTSSYHSSTRASERDGYYPNSSGRTNGQGANYYNNENKNNDPYLGNSSLRPGHGHDRGIASENVRQDRRGFGADPNSSRPSESSNYYDPSRDVNFYNNRSRRPDYDKNDERHSTRNVDNSRRRDCDVDGNSYQRQNGVSKFGDDSLEPFNHQRYSASGRPVSYHDNGQPQGSDNRKREVYNSAAPHGYHSYRDPQYGVITDKPESNNLTTKRPTYADNVREDGTVRDNGARNVNGALPQYGVYVPEQGRNNVDNNKSRQLTEPRANGSTGPSDTSRSRNPYPGVPHDTPSSSSIPKQHFADNGVDYQNRNNAGKSDAYHSSGSNRTQSNSGSVIPNSKDNRSSLNPHWDESTARAASRTPQELRGLSAKRLFQQKMSSNQRFPPAGSSGDDSAHSSSMDDEEAAEMHTDSRGRRQYVLRGKGDSRQASTLSGDQAQARFDLARELSEHDVDAVYPGGDMYVFYLQTEQGDIVGPLRFDIEDVQMGLPTSETSSGLRNRQTGSHGLNEFSSRSHSVLTVTVDSETQPEPEDENLYITKRGKLSFVDLAGSEKVKDSNAPGGPGMVESNSINKSLLVLGNCISHLGDSKRRQGHIPYRDSKLTKLLADSLGGNGITLMWFVIKRSRPLSKKKDGNTLIACITPSSSNVTETMNTLRYASRAKKIKTRPTVKMDPREKLIVTLKKEIKILRQENHYLRQQLDFPAKPKGQLQKENDEKFMKFMKEQQQKESGLYEMLQEYMVENEALRAENSEMISAKDSTRREQQILYKENEKLSKRVEELERLISEHPGTWGLMDHRRTDGYGQQDLSPRGSPVTVGYMSPSHKTGVRPTDLPIGGNRNKVASPVSHGQPLRPPHRLPDHVTRPLPRPVDYVEDGGYANGYMSPRQQSLVKQGVASPRQLDRKASQVSQSDVIRDMNEKLKKDVMQLDGEIQQHARIAHTSQNMKQNYYR